MIHDFGVDPKEHDVVFNIDGKEYSMRRLIETIEILECKTCAMTEVSILNMQTQLHDLQTQLDALSTQTQSISQILDRFRAALY